MKTFAATGDTWGISGPDFLWIYLTALAAATVLWLISWAAASRMGSRRGRFDMPALHPTEAALLFSGDKLAVLAAIAYLRGERAVSAADDKRGLKVIGPMPRGGSRLETTVYEVISGGKSRSVLLVQLNGKVRSTIQTMTADLTSRGLRYSAWQRTLRCLAGAWYLPVLALGITRVVAGSIAGKPIDILLILLTACTAMAFFAPALSAIYPRQTRLASAARKQLAAQVRADAKQHGNTSWELIGGMSAAAAVAILGVAAFWAAEPELAAAAAVILPTTGSTGLFNSGSSSLNTSAYGSSSSCGSSSSSSCGGGSSGGGGCGGGGGGGCGG
jgi:uncharacterized protein (TIGR04222 family)